MRGLRGNERDEGNILITIDVSAYPVVDHPEWPAYSVYEARPKTRRAIVSIGTAVSLVAVIVGVLCVAIPTNTGMAGGLNRLFQPHMSQVRTQQNTMALIAAQAATATAVTQDGYEYQGAGGHYNWAGVQRNFSLPDGTMTGASSVNTAQGTSSRAGVIADSSFHNQFTPGQCTYWANYEYHHLTGYAVPWGGNAAAWAATAAAYGWTVASTPHMYSIIVLQPGVQGAGWAGHVGVVEHINSDGSVATTNWNVRGWGVFSWQTYWPGQGVSFVWHP